MQQVVPGHGGDGECRPSRVEQPLPARQPGKPAHGEDRLRLMVAVVIGGLPPWREAGAVSLDGAAARLECSVYQHVSAGDHDIVLFAIHDHDATEGAGALVFHGSTFRQLAAV